MAHPYSFINLKQPKNTTAGIADFILVAPYLDFVEGGIKCPSAPFVNPGDEIKIMEAHEFEPDRAFAKLVCAPRLNQITAAATGDLGFKKLDVVLDCFVAGSYAEVHEAVKNYLNVPLIVLAKDASCGMETDIWYQIGCDCLQAYLDPSWASGLSSGEGRKGYNLKFSAPSESIRLYDVEGGPAILPD